MSLQSVTETAHASPLAHMEPSEELNSMTQRSTQLFADAMGDGKGDGEIELDAPFEADMDAPVTIESLKADIAANGPTLRALHKLAELELNNGSLTESRILELAAAHNRDSTEEIFESFFFLCLFDKSPKLARLLIESIHIPDLSSTDAGSLMIAAATCGLDEIAFEALAHLREDFARDRLQISEESHISYILGTIWCYQSIARFKPAFFLTNYSKPIYREIAELCREYHRDQMPSLHSDGRATLALIECASTADLKNSINNPQYLAMVLANLACMKGPVDPEGAELILTEALELKAFEEGEYEWSCSSVTSEFDYINLIEVRSFIALGAALADIDDGVRTFEALIRSIPQDELFSDLRFIMAPILLFVGAIAVTQGRSELICRLIDLVDLLEMFDDAGEEVAVMGALLGKWAPERRELLNSKILGLENIDLFSDRSLPLNKEGLLTALRLLQSRLTDEESLEAIDVLRFLLT